MAGWRIRPYEVADRARVRHIVFQTGFMGDPVDWLWRDEDSFADLISAYYTDREPESAFVALKDDTVVGFLLGCIESSKVFGTAADASLGIIRRGAFFWPGVAGFLWRSLRDVLRQRAPLPEEALRDPRWPAHLHINLLPEVRGRGIGRRLMHAWLERLRAEASPGLHLGTFAENTAAIAFFEACGFRRHGPPLLVPGFRSRTGERMHVQWMVRSVDDERSTP